MSYPANVRTYARRLYEQNGWGAHQIRKSLMVRGYNPAHTTVLGWIDDDYAQARREASKYAHRRRRGRPSGVKRLHPWDTRLARLRDLRGPVRLSASAAARVMAHDFGVHLSRHQVEAILSGEVKSKTVRRLLYPEATQ